MNITEKLKQRFNVPENWDKHDYEIHRYSFDDLLEAVELVKESDSLQCVSDSLEGACKTVIETYEGDGMELMNTRDHVMYRACKDAIASCR
jgi:hypothetical protein